MKKILLILVTLVVLTAPALAFRGQDSARVANNSFSLGGYPWWDYLLRGNDVDADSGIFGSIFVSKDTSLEVGVFERTCVADTLVFMTGADSLIAAYSAHGFWTRGTPSGHEVQIGPIVGGKLTVWRLAADTALGDRWQVLRLMQRPLQYTAGIILGNSTITAYSGFNGIDLYMLSTRDSVLSRTITNIAVPGNGIAAQQAVWESQTNKTTYDYIIVEVGLNDLDPTESAATALLRYQTLVATINNQKKASAIVVLGTMTPCKQRLIDLYGETDGAIAYQKWLDINTAIMGGGANPITGTSYRVNAHTIALNDGSGNLAAAYDGGDGIHENNAGRLVVANAYRAALINRGFLSP